MKNIKKAYCFSLFSHRKEKNDNVVTEEDRNEKRKGTNKISACCFFMHVVQEKDSPETAKREYDNFKKAVAEYPNEWREFKNEKTGEHYIYNKDRILNVGKSRSEETINLDNFVQAVKSIGEQQRLKKYDYAYIYKALKEGLFGGGFEGLSVEQFCDYMRQKGLKAGAKSNIYKYMPDGKYPDWKLNKNNILSLEEVKGIVSTLLSIYQELNKTTT